MKKPESESSRPIPKKRIHIISMRIEKSKPADVKHQENLPRPTSETVSTGHRE